MMAGNIDDDGSYELKASLVESDPLTEGLNSPINDPKGSDEKMTMWEMVELVLSNEPGTREENVIERLLPWFKERSTVFGGLEKESLIGMIQNSSLLRCRTDYVIIHQGDTGDCFYVIVRGGVSVYARPRDGTMKPAKEITYARGLQERARFGNELAQLGTGRCFGELSVLSGNGERNASIITDEPTVLICFKRETFLQFVREKFANELLRKSGFVQANNLFRKWPLAYKNLLAECLQIRNVEFGETIIQQGSEVTSIYFVIEGQAKISVNTRMHLNQYRGALSKQFDEQLAMLYESNYDEDESIARFPVLERRRKRRQEGFFANEMRHRPEIDLCLVVGANGLIGDIEAVYDLPTYSTTYRCNQAITLYELDIPSFVRLIMKKNPDTFDTMRRDAEAKIQCRNASIKGGIPLYTVLKRLNDTENNQNRILPKLLPRLIVIQAKKSPKKPKKLVDPTLGIIPDRSGDRTRTTPRSQKMRVNINPATGEVTVTKSPTEEDRKTSIIQWEETRRRQSILSREGTRGNMLPLLKGVLPSLGEEGNQRRENRHEEVIEEGREVLNGEETVYKKLDKVKHVGKVAGHLKTRLRTKGKEDPNKKISLEHYKSLKRKMQAMSRVTHRVSWNG